MVQSHYVDFIVKHHVNHFRSFPIPLLLYLWLNRGAVLYMFVGVSRVSLWQLVVILLGSPGGL